MWGVCSVRGAVIDELRLYAGSPTAAEQVSVSAHAREQERYSPYLIIVNILYLCVWSVVIKCDFVLAACLQLSK